jgi:hypothetical protein
MDAYDWGRVSASAIANLIVFSACVLVAGRMLVETKLPPWRVAIAALTLGYVAANLLRLMAGPEDRWSSHGFGISLLIGVPLLWILVVRRGPPTLRNRTRSREFQGIRGWAAQPAVAVGRTGRSLRSLSRPPLNEYEVAGPARSDLSVHVFV